MRDGWRAPHKACSWAKATRHRPADSLSLKGAPGRDSLPAFLAVLTQRRLLLLTGLSVADDRQHLRQQGRTP